MQLSLLWVRMLICLYFPCWEAAEDKKTQSFLEEGMDQSLQAGLWVRSHAMYLSTKRNSCPMEAANYMT